MVPRLFNINSFVFKIISNSFAFPYVHTQMHHKPRHLLQSLAKKILFFTEKFNLFTYNKCFTLFNQYLEKNINKEFNLNKTK